MGAADAAMEKERGRYAGMLAELSWMSGARLLRMLVSGSERMPEGVPKCC